MGSRFEGSCNCKQELAEMKRKLRFHEEKIMKLEQIQFEMEKMIKNHKPQREKIEYSKPLDPREQLAQKIRPKGGAGHFYGNDKSRANGGVRNAMNELEVHEVLKLLSLGQKKVNFKFEGLKGKYNASGWKMEFGDEMLSFGRVGFSTKFELTYEQIDKSSGKILREFSKKGCGSTPFYPDSFKGILTFLRFNITVLE